MRAGHVGCQFGCLGPPASLSSLGVATRSCKMSHKTTCPKCLSSLDAPFALACPSCGFTLAHLIGSPSPETQPKKDRHTELLTVGSISFPKGWVNASFDYYGLFRRPTVG